MLRPPILRHPKPLINCIILGGLLSNEGGVNMRKTYINYLLFSLFAFTLLCATSGSIDNREKQVHKIVSIVNLICKETDVMARQSSIEPVRIFVLLTFVLIDCYFVKSYLWKAELPVFWGCKFRIQSPRCKLMKSNICSVFA